MAQTFQHLEAEYVALRTRIARAEHAEVENERMRAAIGTVLRTFETDEAQGYHTKDREFAIAILRKALEKEQAGGCEQGK